jgi:hypothetical protein
LAMILTARQFQPHETMKPPGSYGDSARTSDRRARWDVKQRRGILRPVRLSTHRCWDLPLSVKL